MESVSSESHGRCLGGEPARLFESTIYNTDSCLRTAWILAIHRVWPLKLPCDCFPSKSAWVCLGQFEVVIGASQTLTGNARVLSINGTRGKLEEPRSVSPNMTQSFARPKASTLVLSTCLS